jgi:hypothetical protein
MQLKYIILGFAVIILALCLAYLYQTEIETFVEEGADLTATFTIDGYPYDDGRIPDVSDGYMVVDMSSNIAVDLSGEGYSTDKKRWYPGTFTKVESGTYTIQYKNGEPVATEDLSGNRVRMLKKKVRIPTGYLVNPDDNTKLIVDPKFDVQYYSATLYQRTNDATINAPPYTEIPATGLPEDHYKVVKSDYKTNTDGKLVLNSDPEPANKMKKLPDPLPTGYKKDADGTLKFDLTRYALSKYSSTYNAQDLKAYREEEPTEEPGVFYTFNNLGQLMENELTDTSFSPVLYYVPGAYKYGSSNYVPNYEDSVYLSRTTQQPQMAPAYDTAGYPGGFCNQFKGNVSAIEEKCGALDVNTCASTSCCVLLGGQKCVAGNRNGPTRTANYSDYNLQNRDFYYYSGKCYGNCT